MWYSKLNSASAVWTSLLLASTAVATPVAEGPMLRKREWNAQQESEMMCYWQNARSALVGDKIYVDGGRLAFERTLFGGATLSKDTTPRNLLYQLDLTRPFTQKANSSNIFGVTTPKESLNTDVWGGALFATEDQLLLYGGEPEDNDYTSYPSKTQISRYDLKKKSFEIITLPGDGKNLNRMVSRGAYANVPSEKMGFIYGGLRAKDWAEIRHAGGRAKYDATELSDRLISVDMSNMGDEKWANETVSEKVVKPRYDASLTWIPRGAKGSLVLIGGVKDGLYMKTQISLMGKITKDVAEEARLETAKFMTEIPVYDIDAKKWYIQKTNGTPPGPLAQHCAIAARDEDKDLDNIYVVGGYPGLTEADLVSSSVWVLSLPTFTWVKVNDVSRAHARYSQQCHRVSGNRIMAIGGFPETVSDSNGCLQGFILSLDMNTGESKTDYTPKDNEDYKTPEVVLKAIPSKPSPTIASDVQKLMDTEYTKKIPSNYPYKLGLSVDGVFENSDDENKDGEKGGGSSGLPKYIPPLIGTLLGLLVLIIILCAVLFWIRRKKSKGARTVTEGSTVRRNRQTWSWLLGVYGNEKGQYTNSQEDIEYTGPVESDNGMFQPGDRSSQAYSHGTPARPPLVTEYSGSTAHAFSHVSSPTASRPTHSRSNTAEIHGNAVFELPDTPYVSELDSSNLYDPPNNSKKPIVTEYFSPELPGDNTPGVPKYDQSAALPPPPPISSRDNEEKEVFPPNILPPGYVAANNAGPVPIMVPDEDGDIPPPPPPKEDGVSTPKRKSSIEKNTLPRRPDTPPNQL